MRTIGRFLDLSGLTVLWDRIKELLGTKADAVSGKGLSTNDYSDAEKEKVSNAVSGISVSPNTLSVTKNNGSTTDIPMGDIFGMATSGEAGLMSASDKEKLDSFEPASHYALKADIASAYVYRGSVSAMEELPQNAQNGDVYNVETDGMNYAWNGERWDSLGAPMGAQALTPEEIEQVLN